MVELLRNNTILWRHLKCSQLSLLDASRSVKLFPCCPECITRLAHSWQITTVSQHQGSWTEEDFLAANKYWLGVDSDQQTSDLMAHFSYVLLAVLSSASCLKSTPIWIHPPPSCYNHVRPRGLCCLHPKMLFWQKRKKKKWEMDIFGMVLSCK